MISMSVRWKMLAVAALLLGTAAAQEPAPPGSASHPIEAAPIPLTEDEALPPAGKGNMFSDEQLRYCLAQLVRVDAVRPLLDRYEREEVEQFNAMVADFNARCGSYRYKGPALDEAKAWLEEHRAQIDAAARESYMKRFPRVTKVAKTPKKAVAASSQPNPEVTATARAITESAAVPPSKPAVTPQAATASPASSPKSTESASDTAKPAAAQPQSRATNEDKPARPASKPASPPQTTTATSEPSSPRPKGSTSEASKPAAPPTPPPAVRDERLSAAASKPASPTASKPKDIAGEASTKPSNASAPAAPEQAPSGTAEPQAVLPETPAPTESLISKPRQFPATGPDTSAASQAPDKSAPAATSTATTPPAPPSEDKAVKSKPAPSAATTAQAEPSTKPQAKERESAPRTSVPHTASKPASKPPRPLPSARKTEPPAQVAAVAPAPAPTPQAATRPDAALERLTKEIQRAGSQVLPQPAGASETNTDLTTQVEVRYAEGGWVRSIVVGESSGSPALDEQALALARATRFPDVPEELRSREFSVRFPVVFRAAR